MKLEYLVRLIGGDESETATVTCDNRDSLCYVTVSYRDRKIEESASDYFKALCLARMRLEAEGLNLFCYGSSLNVRPSGMGRDMGSGLLAYKLAIGKRS